MKCLSHKMEQVRTLKKDMGLQYIIDEAYRILENPIILYDLDWKILAYPEGVITDDPIWNNHIIGGTVNNNIAIYINEGFIDLMIKPDKVVFLSSDKVKYDRYFGKIFDGDGNIVAGVSVVSSYKSFEYDDIMITGAICKILSYELLKIPYYQNIAQKKVETCINALINKELKDITDRLYVSAYVEMIYNGLKNNLYLAIVDLTQCDPTGIKLEYYKDLFKQTKPDFKYSIYSNCIVIIMSTNEAFIYPKRVFGRLNGLFERDNIKIGISSRFENLFDLRKHYTEAAHALKLGLKSNGTEQYFLHREYEKEVPE